MSVEEKPEAEPTRESILLLFVGSRRLSGKIRAAWVRIDKDENDGEKLNVKSDENRIHYFRGKALVKGIQPGTYISIDATKDYKIVYPPSAKVLGVWDNEEDVATWNALHRAIDREEAAQGKAVKAIKESLPAVALVPYRRAYHRAKNAAQRAQILAFVIEEITKFKE